eukprot:1661210-Pleurochrysis_carterae.AAC.2
MAGSRGGGAPVLLVRACVGVSERSCALFWIVYASLWMVCICRSVCSCVRRGCKWGPHFSWGVRVRSRGVEMRTCSYNVLTYPKHLIAPSLLYYNRPASPPLSSQVWYTVDRPPAEWKYSSGFINEDMVRDHLPAPSKETVTFMCGPPKMLEYACIPNLKKVGHTEGTYFAF